ncbi:MAG: YlbE-like protein [Haloplasmataceae bacterium]|jgi:hypothetical protein|nr:YlbE-like protein [Haloplasmataceae bacterium]
MTKEITEQIYKKQEILFYIRTHPEWYKILNRHPDRFTQFNKIAKDELQITLQHKVDRFKNQVEILTLLNDYMKRS